MLGIEFWVLLAVTVVMHSATFAVAALIYWKQQRFNTAMFQQVTVAIASIEHSLTADAIRDRFGPILIDVVRKSMGGILGNFEKKMKSAGIKGSGAIGALRAFMSKGSLDTRLGHIQEALASDDTVGDIDTVVSSGQTEKGDIADKVRAMDAFAASLLTVEQKNAFEKKKEELGLT